MPRPKSGRIRQAMGVFDLRRRLLPSAAVVGRRFPGLFPAAKTVLAVGRRPVRQDGEGQSTRPAHAAADPNPVVAFIVCLFPSTAMTRDRVLAAPRTPSWQERQGKCSHLGSDLSSGSGGEIKRITTGVKAPPLTSVLARGSDLWRAFTLPVYSTPNEKKNTAVCRHPKTHSFWGLAGILPSFVHNLRPTVRNRLFGTTSRF
jgi:hypothetical protein